MEELARSNMVEGMNFDGKLDVGLCECCMEGKSHSLPFQSSMVKRVSA